MQLIIFWIAKQITVTKIHITQTNENGNVFRNMRDTSNDLHITITSVEFEAATKTKNVNNVTLHQCTFRVALSMDS